MTKDQVVDFCRKWNVTEFAAFGSVLRDDFRTESDVDVLVTFDPMAVVDLYNMIEMRDELAKMVGRPVDVIEKSAVRNPFRRHHILSTYRVIYAA